jgi:ABC-2 type transport system ATP-binding protein
MSEQLSNVVMKEVTPALETEGRQAVISVKNLVKKYGELCAVNNVSFEVNPGEIFAFLGPNGAGKSTTIEILECLRPLTSGTVSVLGYDIRNGHQVEKIKERIGVLPQDFCALNRLTVKENLKLFAGMYSKSKNIDELIDLLGLTEKAKVQLGNLSGGLRQRVGVAAALVNDPDVVFLDEPTTGLDPDIRRVTWSILKGLKKSGKTIFLTTHYMEEAQELADRICVIAKGKIVALGTPDELMEKFGGGKTMVFKNGGKRVFDAVRVASGNVSLSGNDVILPFTQISEVAKALDVISQQGLSCGMEERSPNMEDVFLKLTGFNIKAGGESA